MERPEIDVGGSIAQNERLMIPGIFLLRGGFRGCFSIVLVGIVFSEVVRLLAYLLELRIGQFCIDCAAV